MNSVDLFSKQPDYDSGWVSIAQDSVKALTHNLGGDTDEYVVDLQFRDTGAFGFGVNQLHYGSQEYIDFSNFSGAIPVENGAYWYALTDNEIKVKRNADDKYADKVRVRIWIAPSGDFDSGWRSYPADGLLKNIDHNLGGDADKYIVDMQFKDTSLLGIGIHQYGYGIILSYLHSLAVQPESRGALWRNLTNAIILVARGTEDKAVDNLRVRIWKDSDPDYDSGWIKLDAQSTKTLNHKLGGNTDDYVVDFQFRDEGDEGVNQQYYGGNYYNVPPTGAESYQEGGNWSLLTNTHISLWRELDDGSAPQARVRIWVSKYGNHINLPLVIR
jgi:hypothetical protein